MSDKNNGPAANKWGTDSNKQDNMPSQPVPWNTNKYKEMTESQNNAQVKVNNSHGNENSDDSDEIDSVTAEEIISKSGKFTQNMIESGLIKREEAVSLLKQTLKQKKKQINHKDEKRVFTCGASDKQTMELNQNVPAWMKERKNMFENQQKNNNTDLQADKLNNQQNMESSNFKVINTDMGTFYGVEIYNEAKDGTFQAWCQKMKEANEKGENHDNIKEDNAAQGEEKGLEQKSKQEQENKGIMQYLKKRWGKLVDAIYRLLKRLKDQFGKSAKENNKLESMTNNFSQQQNFSSEISINVDNIPKRQTLSRQYLKN